MKVRPLRPGPARALALCLLACLSTQAFAAPGSPARKPPASRKPPPPKADFQTSFAAAVASYENFDYEKSLEQLNRAKALAQGVDQEVPVALYLGIVHAELGNREQSLASFRTGLYLQPEAKLPVKVSPRVERDFEEVRQAVLRDLGPAKAPVVETHPVPPPSDRPVPPPTDTPALTPVAPPSTPPAYADTGVEKGSRRGSVLSVVLLGTGAVAGGAAGFFGLQSASNVRFARNTEFFDTREERLKHAENQAFVANILFGTASAAALGALATFLIPGSEPAPASTSTGGASP